MMRDSEWLMARLQCLGYSSDVVMLLYHEDVEDDETDVDEFAGMPAYDLVGAPR